MMETRDRKAFTDVSIIIKMMPQNMQNKINKSFIEFIEENKDKEYQSSINKNIPLKNQELNENTKTLLALIYRDYLCSEVEREKLILEEGKELKRIEEEKKNRYAIDFEKKKIDNELTENALVEYKKESIIHKFFNKVKRLFKIN